MGQAGVIIIPSIPFIPFIRGDKYRVLGYVLQVRTLQVMMLSIVLLPLNPEPEHGGAEITRR